MALFRKVDGRDVKLSDEEEVALRAQWASRDLERIVREKAREIHRFRERVLNTGFIYHAPGKPGHGATFELTAEARSNITTLTIGISAEVIHYWDRDNVPHPMTVAEFIAFAEQTRNYVAHVYQVARSYKDALKRIATNNTTTVEHKMISIKSMDVTTGWELPK